VNSATSEVQFDAPVIAMREAESDVLVRDGQTVVLGGLREYLPEV
jgi:type II secretory pathway component GspD/PulD (secretin)